ncbi:MAG TPA: phosphotransferase [Tahibacter sp.]|uniref:aminoglycoside phosphotransferase family protein n=1 Tax=Tahibacter sp. TaxID=2056211 RepID=UPI002B6060F8|nr:phosphotransferase [Tahibacter sp.]HSX61324.1 phosphotransferase [Tahibacter sp.]
MTSSDSQRSAALHAFVAACGADPSTLAPASADASFRSYWRVQQHGRSAVVMDSPPDKEPVEPWLAIGAQLAAAGLHVPSVYAANVAQGLLLIEDFGTRTYLPELDERSADALYTAAFDALFVLQTRLDGRVLERYDEARLQMELDYLPEWLLQRHLDYTPDCGDWDVIELAFRQILSIVQAQPYCFVHRDFHSRNLMIAPPLPGIIDFQGALHGPLTYDLASLLRDCYIRWPAARVDAWVEAYRQRLVAAGRTAASAEQFRRWFDFTGLQRHIKVLGLFCRLCYRDGKPHYLADLPLVLDYVREVCAKYPELAGFDALLARATAGVDLRRRRADAAA